MHYVKTNKEGSLRILRKHLQITDTEAVEGTYEFFAKRLARSPRTELEGIKNILTSIDAGHKNPAEFRRHEFDRRDREGRLRAEAVGQWGSKDWSVGVMEYWNDGLNMSGS